MRNLFNKVTKIPLTKWNCSYNRIKLEIDTIGFCIVEQEPQQRTILSNNSIFELENIVAKRIQFPYVQFHISYVIINEKFYYLGMNEGINFPYALKVSFSSKPISSFNSTCYNSLLESPYTVCVCTPHQLKENDLYDGKPFDTLEELQKKVISTYWSLFHVDYKIEFSFDEWAKKSKEEILKLKFPFKQDFNLNSFQTKLKYFVNRKNGGYRSILATTIEEKDEIKKDVKKTNSNRRKKNLVSGKIHP